jgi:predicted dithiol-disulfide oxidoreductase (DUF899 family)
LAIDSFAKPGAEETVFEQLPSSFGSDFNYDFQVTFTEAQQQSGVVEYNFRPMDTRSELADAQTLPVFGTDAATVTREAPGMSAFALKDGVVSHLLGVHARAGRRLGNVPVARPRPRRAQRDDGARIW